MGQRSLSRTQLAEYKGSVSPSDFSAGWVRDALVSEAVRLGLLELSSLRQTERSVLSRTLLERLYTQANDAGPPTDGEMARICSEKWFLVERPAAAKVSHFVVRSPDSSLDGKAYQLAQVIANRVKGIGDAISFVQVAKSVRSEGLDVVAESLPPMTADGRGLKLDKDGQPVAEGPTFDATFARAANDLEVPGSQSAIVKTPFGYHVLILEQRIAGYRMPIDERRRVFAADIVTRRARQESDRSIESAKTRLSVKVEPNFQEILEKSQVLP